MGPSCAKAKWRITLHQDAQGGTPTSYKVEGTLYPSTPREGRWAIERGSSTDTDAIVYRLASAAGNPALLLRKGDDDVLFFLDRGSRPLTGHAEYSYTLNRRRAPAPSSAARKP